ncbi:MAG TPA: MFS transporter [Candidatus Cloacimonadota bacterium]|nr:MFS transporter [Candidatus Cloacimonadota bacterium]HPT71199.1 MFS transporter [Candidatus Cloacimonadota bacterium]
MIKEKTRKLVDFLGLKRSLAALLLMVIFVGLGERMAERFLPIYILALVGIGSKGNWIIGLLNGTTNLLNALYSFPGGYLSDKLGYKRALLFFNLIAMFGYLIVILFPYWQAVIIGSIFFLSWTAISLPASMSLVSANLPKNKRTMGVSMHSFIRKIPMALGPIIGGILIHYYGERTGVRLAFCFAFLMGFISIFIQQNFIQEDKEKKTPEKSPLTLFKYMDTNLRNLLVSDILIRFCEQIPYAFVVVWAMEMHHISSVQFGLLTAVEMVTSMLIYIPVAYLADKSSKKPYIVITFINFTLFPLVMIFSKTFGILVLAFILRGLKEFGEPTRKALIMDLAPEGKKAGMFGLYYLIRDVLVSVAAFGGAWFWNIKPELNFLIAFIFGLLGTLYFQIFGKDLTRIGSVEHNTI